MARPPRSSHNQRGPLPSREAVSLCRTRVPKPRAMGTHGPLTPGPHSVLECCLTEPLRPLGDAPSPSFCSSRVLFTGLSCSSSPIRSAFLFRSNAPASCSRAARRARPVPLIRVCRRRGAAEPRASSPGASSLRSGSPFPLRPGPQRFDRFRCSFDVF